MEIKTNYNHRKTLLNLAWPLILTQAGHIITGITDTIFLGFVSSTHQAAGILANNVYILILVFSIGVSYAITPLVTQANELNESEKKIALFKNALFLNFLVAILSFILLYSTSNLLYFMQQPKVVVELAVPFYNVLIFSMIPVSIFFTCKQYCEGLSNTKIALWVSVIGNLVNIVLNYALIFGKLGLPEMGYIGAAWASFISRIVMGGIFLVILFKSRISQDVPKYFKKVKINFSDVKALSKIAFPSGFQISFEVAAFVVSGLMCGIFGKNQIDAHGIALHLASLTYMFGSGIGSAATIQTGIFFTQKNYIELKESTRQSLFLILSFMGLFMLLFILLRNILPYAFTHEHDIVSLASNLLLIAAFFQLFDGAQVTLMGVLRGMKDVKIPTFIAFLGYWIISIPLGYFLGIYLNFQSIGIWVALCISLMIVALCLFWRYKILIKKLNSARL
ncbi:MAG: MATE family efflux transporter [Bacteroidetes bacterium]|nr:MATE family efflux transporter [Bacteroidota bacterium]